MKAHADEIVREGRFQVIWQTGKYYEREMDEFMRGRDARGIWRGAFIERMDLAYAAADVVVARSGAGTVSELCLVGKTVVFVPSPNVAEDHQTKNAMALADRGAALVVPDREAVARVFSEVGRLLADDAVRSEMEKNIRALAVADSADRVADEILKVVKRSE